jgi:hypothetical protein
MCHLWRAVRFALNQCSHFASRIEYKMVAARSAPRSLVVAVRAGRSIAWPFSECSIDTASIAADAFGFLILIYFF